MGQVIMKTYTMGRTQRNYPVFGCVSSNVAELSNRLAQVHNMDTEERKKWLKWSKIGICVPLKDKDANERHTHGKHVRETSKRAGGNGNTL